MAIRVLITDDSVSARELLRWHMTRLGFEVVGEAQNGSQAIALFRLFKPDLVTLDVVMPNDGGIDALTAFRFIRKEAPWLPILVISAVPFDTTRRIFIQEGAFDYLLKPFNRNLKDAARKLHAMFSKRRPQGGVLGLIRRPHALRGTG